MRTAEDSSGTVLHRLIQEQLRFGNLTDTRTLLAIQQQALRGGSGSSGGGTGSPRSSLESLTQEETQYIHMSARQEPQGQEHQGNGLESPVCHLYQLHGEELPTYEEAKAHSQYLNSQKEQQQGMDIMIDMKREHARSLSERLMQLSLERNGPRDNISLSSSHSYPQLYNTTNRGPPPEYPQLPGYMYSHSQEHAHFYRDPPPPFHSHQHRYVSVQPTVVQSDTTVLQTDALIRENEWLRKELEVYTEKAVRLHKLESEIQRISEAYETLMKGSSKREALEKTMRNRLEAEIKRMYDFNRDMRDQLDTATKQRVAKEAECSDQKQHVFLKLLEQNEEQQRERERLERQIQHLRVSGEECQHKREMMEQALVSAQARNRQLEEELQRKRAYVEKVERLQSSLAQLQAACEKRETLELRLRNRLEQELKSLRAQQSQNQKSDTKASELSSTILHQQLREREEQVLALEADITKWEQKYLEESTMRQFAMDAAATAAAQRDTTIINNSPRHSPHGSFNEDLPLSSQKHQEMENRIRALHAQLLEKDAMIKVLQQRSRWEQSRPEKLGMRLAISVPSINTMARSTECKGKSLSSDQTGAEPCLHRDSSTQSDETPRHSELHKLNMPEEIPADTTEAPQLKTVEGLNSSDPEVVEILI